MRDIKSIISPVQSLAPAVIKAGTAGASADLEGFNSAMVVFACGTLTDGTHTPKVQESDDGTTFTDVDASDLIGTLAAMADSTVQAVGYVGAKRYILAYMTSSGTTGAAISACILRGHPAQAPVA